jgi:CheY-like chemotaxis protein
VGSAVGNNKGGETRTVKILHVEDNEMVVAMVKEMLEDQGWQIQTCADGNAAIEKISGEDEYDLLPVDYDLPGSTAVGPQQIRHFDNGGCEAVTNQTSFTTQPLVPVGREWLCGAI